MRSIFRACAVLALVGSIQAMASSGPSRAGLTLDDLFKNSVLSNAVISTDGEWVAVTVIRPVDENAVYGRVFYEMDSTRSDVWLISRRTGESRNITQGAANASGSWCASWSPDGSRLALMSTKPEGNEPRGGDNVRLYLWERAGDALKRLTSRAIASPTMGGSAMYRIDLQGQKTRDVARCSNEESAPFIWLDDTSLLAIMLPEGAVSGIVDAYTRPLAHAGETLQKLREGKAVTATISESGVAPAVAPTASLQVIDASTGKARTLAEVPLHPFDGNLQVSVAPNGKTLAVLATNGSIAHESGKTFAYPFDTWQMRRQLGFVDLQGSAMRWVFEPPASAKYPIDLQGWSSDSSTVAVRARPDAETRSLTLLSASVRDLSMTRLSPEGMSVAASMVAPSMGGATTVFFTDDGRLLARAVNGSEELGPFDWYRNKARGLPTPRADWWAFARGRAPTNLTAGMKASPDALFATRDRGQFLGVADDALWMLDTRTGKATKLAGELPAGASVIWPGTSEGLSRPTSELIVAGRPRDGVPSLVHVKLSHGKAIAKPLALPSDSAELLEYDAAHSLALFRDPDFTGTFLWALDPTSGGRQKLLALNEHLANVDPGELRFIEYRGIDGEALKGAVLLPPNYQPGKKYPVLTWVYAGATVRDKSDHSLRFSSPGQYNLRLYAAQGYVVLWPTMPLRRDGRKSDDYVDLPKGVMPALDRLIELGIADPDRLAVMGQSYGGYSVYSLVTYTKRFKAAIAMAGLTDLVSVYGQFDPTARGYPGIEHQKSVNWGLAEQGQLNRGGPPAADLFGYLRNSPLYYVDRVETPLLLIHGELDIRGPMTQAEEFFYGLYRQGKRAKLLRYWGEDHGLRQSPANVRDIVDQIFDWLKINMPEQ